MNFLNQNYSTSILVGLAVILPLFVLEWITTNGFSEVGFPTVLFLFMWANGALFFVILVSAFKDIQGKNIRKNFLRFTLKVIALTILTSAWITIVIDQMPCFLGSRGC